MAKFGQGGMPSGVGQGIIPEGSGSGFGDFFDSIRPEQGSRAQRDLVLGLIGGANEAAAQTNNPLLAFLTPLVGGAVANRTENKFNEAEKLRTKELSADLLANLGGGEKSAQALDILSNPDAPDHLKKLAEMMLTRDTAPPKRGRAKSRKTLKDRFGVTRYVDTGEPVFPNVEGGGIDPARWGHVNTTIETLNGAATELYNSGQADSMEEAEKMLRGNPMYAPLFTILDSASPSQAPTNDPADIRTEEAPLDRLNLDLF
ncbi:MULTISPECIES: hypothetical protein [Halocynthiibacter]|uniref:Uncharacterized protein n=1 Tax=Halocynthiibacter halioticoli TaxID=2986804 RepID=A0AAE3J1M3_9RHOB|nr:MULTISPECIES: hypothetical protein [Halocynthiibacter]MCV6825999.1 hypothetical protein [Halocynthiibacter halioticoli]MCW4059000.1 hypothetical protein [Halocynthiibacter sp. SDUM655004]